MASTTKVPLKYLFTVQYKDGPTFWQQKDDISTVDPKRSAFYDVDIPRVRWFFLQENSDRPGPYTYIAGVNPEDGTFYVGGNTFKLGDPGPAPYTLIFWRQHTHNFTMGLDELSHEVKYILGYSDADGKEHTITIE